ncbi:MAG TPA: carboxypeptidase regulatory-like domain-containing protein [Dongiaceae bacterium]|nr:carboxypeptidase regulatory-like domain-containing protein [Dongiaceae bacterium]
MRWRSVFASALVLCIAMLFASGTLLAQQYSGTVTGAVTDPSGSAVPGAAVSLINVGTNALYTGTTNDQGAFTVAQVPVGTYELHVKAGNFKEYIAKGVEVHTSTVTEENVQLSLGSSSETITVEASDVQVQTTSAAVGEIVGGTQVRELPLNGENFMGLVTLSPGVSAANSFDSRDKGLTGGADFSVNGNPYNYNLFLVDGVNNNDVGSGRTILVYPSTDTIAEFKMIRNAYGPEYGQASGAIISITTRSGENQWHGGVFYSGRNDKLDANDWFSNFNHTGKAELRRNDWGYHVAGPIVKNKLWFWWNQEWNREVRGTSVAACVPTAAEKVGDFSADVASALNYLNTNPTKGAGDVGNATTCGAVPPATFTKTGSTWSATSRIPGDTTNSFKFANPDPAGMLVAQFYPDPNNGGNGFAGANNWAQSENGRPTWSEWNVRGDYDVTKKNRITFRWTHDSWDSPSPNPNLFWGDSIFPTVNANWSQPSKSVMAKLTTQIGNSMVNDLEFGWGYNAIVTSLNSEAVPLVSAINAAIPSAWPTSLKSLPALPGFNAGGWGGLSPYGSGQEMWSIAPYANHEDLYTFQDNLSKVQGNHLWKFGAFYGTNAKIENNNGGVDQPSFNPADNGLNTCPSGSPVTCVPGTPTGNALANILVPGQVYITSESSLNNVARIIWHDFEWYVGDTWKLKKNLTLTYGFRWSFYREPYAENNHLTSFSLAAYDPNRPASDACNGIIIVPGTTPCQDAVANLASLGVSLPLSDGTPGPNRALVNNNNHAIAPRLGIAWDPKGDGKTAIRVGVGQFYQREPVGIDEQRSGNAPFVINAQDIRTIGTPSPLNNPAVSPCCAKDPRAVLPNSWQWNLSVERQFARNMTVQVGYVGNTLIHGTSMLDLNAVPKSDWVDAAFLTGSAQNLLRPAGNFGSIQDFARNGHGSYHSLQTLFRWQTSNFSQFQAAYTYSHSIANVELDNSSGSVNQQATTDQSNGALDKGNTNINRPHIFVANEVFFLPKLANHSALVREAFGGWELNSIISITSGASLTVFSNNAGDLNGSALTSIMGSGFNNNVRPDITSISCNANENGRQILNPAAFTFVGHVIGTPGDAPRGYCFGPHYRNVDAQLAKNWNFKERYRLKFAMDFFNLFNHANFYSIPGTNFNAGGLECGNTACSPTNNIITGQAAGQNGSFGQAGSVRPGRELQYSLKFTF